MIVLIVIKIMYTYISYCNVCAIMEQIHLSTLEKILYYNMQGSGKDYNVHVN